MAAHPPWTCDACGKPIGSVEEGWVEWLGRLEKGDTSIKERDLRLVHAHPASPRKRPPHCQHDESAAFAADISTVSDLPLSEFMGDDGLMLLLEKIADDDRGIREEWIELAKRLHITGYEQAREHFERAIYDGVIEPRGRPGFHEQHMINATIQHAQELSKRDS